MKRLSIALAAIGISAGAFAAVQAGSMPTEVTVPQNAGGFYVGVLGNYVQPSATDGDLSFASTTVNTTSTLVGPPPVTTATSANSFQNIKPKFNWGVGGKIGYDFPGTGNNVEVDYYHLFRTNTNANASGVVAGVGAVFPGSGYVSGGYKNIATASNYRLDQVDLLAGQYVNVGCRLSLHPFVGVRYADLDRNINTAYAGGAATVGTSGATSATSVAERVAETSDYQGVGPEVGIDATYFIMSGFGAELSTDVAGLYGNMKANTNAAVVQNVTGGGIVNTTGVYNQPSLRRFVPVVDVKLGLNYTLMLGGSPVAASNNSSVTLAAGWQTSTYFNSVDRLTVNDPILAGGIRNVTTSNFSFSGPYATLTYHM